jgi:hypothetical protein
MLVALALSGCAAPSPPMPESEAIALLRSGRQLLRCHEACLPAWQEAEPKAELLARSRSWGPLAALVLDVDYQDDLTFYYLGRAAEGLGFASAAASFYAQSVQLSGTSASCTSLSRQCGGVSLPQAAASRLAMLRRGWTPAPRRKAGEPRRRPTEVEPAALEEPPPMPAPPQPTAAQPERPVRSPATRSPASSDYIEPPPAPR